jgi:hypothetical protein
MHVDIKVTLISTIGAVLVALIGFIGTDPFHLFEKETSHEVNMPKVEEPKKLVSVPIIGTAVQFQIFEEDFENINTGWEFSRDYYLENGRLNIHVNKLSGTVHPFLNQNYQIGKGPFSATFEAKYLSGTDWTYGFVLKAIGRQEFVFLSLRKNGTWRITHLDDKGWNDISEWKALPDGWSPNTRITITNANLKGEGSPEQSISYATELKENEYDESLYIYADEILLGDVRNPIRGVGKQFGFFSTMNIHASFDNLTVHDMSLQFGLLVEGSCVIWAGSERCPEPNQ